MEFIPSQIWAIGLVFARIGAFFMPVSYTHLDVYKRQNNGPVISQPIGPVKNLLTVRGAGALVETT